VPGSLEDEVTLPARVVVERLPKEYQLESLEPEQVEVTLTGRRRDLLLARQTDVVARIDALLVKLGRRNFELSPDAVTVPTGVEVVRIFPGRVKLTVVGGAPAPAPEAPLPVAPLPEAPPGL
jgi:hypothetical protein